MGATTVSAVLRWTARTTARATSRGKRVRKPRLPRERSATVDKHAGLADESRLNDRDAHTSVVEVLPQAEGESAQPKLGCVINGGVGRWNSAPDGADEDDVTGRPLLHQGDKLAGHQNRRTQIHSERVIDVRPSEVSKLPQCCDTRVRDEHVNLSDLIDQPRDLLRLGEVGGDERGAQLARELLQDVDSPARENQNRSLRAEFTRYGMPDTAGRASQQDRLTPHVHHRPIFWRSPARTVIQCLL